MKAMAKMTGIGLMGTLFFAMSVQAETIRDNEVHIYHSEGESAVTFVKEGHSSTQTFESFTTDPGKQGYLYVNFRSGRQGSSSVASWFNNQNSGSTPLPARTEHSGVPNELNLAFHGKLNLAGGESIPITLGQGHTSSGLMTSSNDWWVGASGATRVGACLTNLRSNYSTKYKICVDGSNFHAFTLSRA